MNDIRGILEKYQGENIKIIGMGSESIWQEMIIVNCKNSRHIHTIAEQITRYLKQNKKVIPKVEGKAERDRDWVVVDADTTIIHLLSPEARNFYNLEGIWADEQAAKCR